MDRRGAGNDDDLAPRLHRQEQRIAQPHERRLRVDLPIQRKRFPGMQMERAQKWSRSGANYHQVRLPLLQNPSGCSLLRGVSRHVFDACFFGHSFEAPGIPRERHYAQGLRGQGLHDAATKTAASADDYCRV